MKKFLTIVMILVLSLSLYGFKNNQNIDKQKVSVMQTQKVVKDKVEDINLGCFIPQTVLYNDNNCSITISQMIFNIGGTETGEIREKNEDGSKSEITLYYLAHNKIEEIDLIPFALKYNLLHGVDYVSCSPSGKYIVLELGSSCDYYASKSLLINTKTKDVKVLWDNKKDGLSMYKVSWKYDDDNVFAFLSANEKGNFVLKKYNIKEDKIQTIADIDSKGELSGASSLLRWNTNKIIVTDPRINIMYSVDV